jgi:hypothetical protein
MKQPEKAGSYSTTLANAQQVSVPRSEPRSQKWHGILLKVRAIARQINILQ